MSRRQYERKKAQILAIKAQGCLCCGETDTDLIDLHHVDPSQKTCLVSAMLSWPTLLAEIEKCVPLCKICHRRADLDNRIIRREDHEHDHAPYICRHPGGTRRLHHGH